MQSVRSGDITSLLKAWAGGDPEALHRLAPLVYQDLRRRARSYMANEACENTLQSTALVNEAFLQLIGADVPWEDRAHFFAVSAQIMRRILVSSARARRSEKRGGGAPKINLNESIDGIPDRGRSLVALDDALDDLAKFDHRKAKVVEMRFFGGLNEKEIAGVLKISEATVRRDWAFARAWLMDQMQDAPVQDAPDR